MENRNHFKKGVSTPMAIIIAGVLISVAVLYSNGNLPFLDKTKSSGTDKADNSNVEVPANKMTALASTLGLDADKFQACVDKKDTSEITKDSSEAASLEANGTPAFFIGKKIDNNQIEGIRIFGAYPLATFESVIEAFKSGDNSKVLAVANEVNKIAQIETVFKTYEEAVVKVSMDDDAYLGSKDASVAIVEFSDYECPFCQRHFKSTYPALKSKYLDSGQVGFVFRDLPLPFHDPMATDAAVAANCARELGGDEGYYKYHDAYFANTQANGKGLP